MAYIGAEPVPGQNREVDDISSGFNGNATAFTLQVNSVNVSPESAKNILVNLGGVLQNPDTDYTINASTLTFTTAPASGLSFFGLILGAGINTATVADGAITTAKLASDAVGANQLANTSVTAGSYTTADITVDAQGRITAAASGTISGAEIADQAVTNAKVNNSAAIAGSKISPDFGSQNIVTTGEIKSNTLFESASGNDLRLNAGSANRDIFFQVNDSTLTTVQGSTGNVGIGTSSPSDKLHVRGASAAFTAFILDNATNSSSPYKITYGDQGQVNHLVVANRELTFGTNNAERVRIDSSGNVGIGTTSPSRRLDLNIGGDQTWFEINKSRAANEAMLQLVHSAGNRAAAIRYANADDGWKVGIDGTEGFTFANGATNTGDGTERMRIDSSGVSIFGTKSGNAVPNVNLILGIINSSGDSKKAQIESNKIADISSTIEFHTTKSHSFGERARFDHNGHLLIGATTKVAAETVGLTFDNNSFVGYLAKCSATGSATFMDLRNSSGTALGNIRTSNGSDLQFNTSASDRSLKKNFENWTENTLELFKNINPQKFNFIQEEDTDFKHKGYVAQDMIDSFPEAYNKNDDNKYMFNPSGMVVYLMKAIQELETKVAALEAA